MYFSFLHFIIPHHAGARLCVRLYKCSKKFSSKKIWYGSFSYIKGLKNYINEKVPCSVLPDFPQKKQNFTQKKSVFVAHRKSAFCSQKKKVFCPRKKDALFSQKRMLSPIYNNYSL
tara:strand:+ start:11014 stop:11361 length:348 start_codon:yes stop_codon:yes gene_type:complete